MNQRPARRLTGRPRGERQPGQADLEITGHDGVFTVHTTKQAPPHLLQAAAELHQHQLADQVTVLVGAGFARPDLLHDRLAPTLAQARADGARVLRLVMAGAAADRPDQPAPARAFSESESVPFEVLAPRGLVIVAPGGTLFAPDLSDAPGGWWSFSPGLAPRRIGTRLPEPPWQGAVERTAPPTVGGCVVEQIPAGLLVLPGGTPPEGASALRYAMPPDPAGPLLVVGSSRAAAVSPDALAEVIAALPAHIRGVVRLVPGGGTDLLPLGQSVADLLGAPVQVASGLPLLLDDPKRPEAGRATTPRVVLTDAGGDASWRPYVEVVTCVPREGDTSSAPRLGAWRSPIGGLRPGIEPGAMMLDRKWEVVVTRAGLWIGPNGFAVPDAVSARPVEPEMMTVDVGVPESALDASVWDPLDRLFTALQDDVRERTLINLMSEGSEDDLRALRRLAVRHGLSLASREWQGHAAAAFPAEEAVAPRSVPAAVPTGVQGGAATEQAPAPRPTPTPAERPEPAVALVSREQPGPAAGHDTESVRTVPAGSEPPVRTQSSDAFDVTEGSEGAETVFRPVSDEGFAGLLADPVPSLPVAVAVTFTPPAASSAPA